MVTVSFSSNFWLIEYINYLLKYASTSQLSLTSHNNFAFIYFRGVVYGVIQGVLHFDLAPAQVVRYAPKPGVVRYAPKLGVVRYVPKPGIYKAFLATKT